MRKPGAAFRAQMYFLHERHRRLAETRPEDSAAPIVSDFLFEKDKIFAYVNLDNEELKLYEKYFDMLAPSVPAPDLVIYLHAKPEVLQKRVSKKGDPSREADFTRIPRSGCQRLRTLLLPLLRVESAGGGHHGNRFRRAQPGFAGASAASAPARKGHAILSSAGSKLKSWFEFVLEGDRESPSIAFGDLRVIFREAKNENPERTHSLRPEQASRTAGARPGSLHGVNSYSPKGAPLRLLATDLSDGDAIFPAFDSPDGCGAGN